LCVLHRMKAMQAQLQEQQHQLETTRVMALFMRHPLS
jgi:hypothetical protein